MFPRLRPDLELFPVDTDDEGDSAFALHDPEGMAPETAVLQRGALAVLTYFDGSRSFDDIRVELAKRGAGFVRIEDLETLAEALDRLFLLDNERYRSECARRAEEFLARPERAATHAGAAYPAEPGAARRYLDEMLGTAAPAEELPLSRLIAPHIDLGLGAEVYAHAHRRLQASGRPDAVVVLGVCHAASRDRFILCRKDFATPLGPVRHDAALADALEERMGRALTGEQYLHRAEHSVEFQALWLAHLWPGDPPAMLPLLIGSFQELVDLGRSPSEDPEVEAFVAALRETIAADSRRIVTLASVDFAHVGPRYDHAAGLDEAGERALERQDLDLLELVSADDAEGFFESLALDANARNVCGLAPVYLTLRLGEGGGRLLRYGQGRIDPETGSVVSFAAVAFER